MERELPSKLVGGSSAFLSPSLIGQVTDGYRFNTTISGASYAMFSNVYQEKTVFPMPDYAFGGPPVDFPLDPATYGYYMSEEFTAFQQKHLVECSTVGDQRFESIGFNAEKLKPPKDEPLDNGGVIVASSELANVRSEYIDAFSKLCYSNVAQLPNLQSLEKMENAQVKNGFGNDYEDMSISEASTKRVRSESHADSYTLDAILKDFKLSNLHLAAPLKSPGTRPPPVTTQSDLARQRRQKISDKTRCLQKLLPSDKKMDMATMLEEAYKYVKFLQAQVRVLQSMPYNSTFESQIAPYAYNAGRELVELGRLNRQQLLQVLLNSPVAQSMMYSQGCCVFSLEQLIVLRKIDTRKIVLEHMLSNPSNRS